MYFYCDVNNLARCEFFIGWSIVCFFHKEDVTPSEVGKVSSGFDFFREIFAHRSVSKKIITVSNRATNIPSNACLSKKLHRNKEPKNLEGGCVGVWVRLWMWVTLDFSPLLLSALTHSHSHPHGKKRLLSRAGKALQDVKAVLPCDGLCVTEAPLCSDIQIERKCIFFSIWSFISRKRTFFYTAPKRTERGRERAQVDAYDDRKR
jgi:hypothetical protein